MGKVKTTKLPRWVINLREMMEQQGYNPRSLSLKAGLNATAVRDMLEGRSRFPRYDTATALAEALSTTPAKLMNDKLVGEPKDKGHDLTLLIEIIARLQEITGELDHKLAPRDFAAMTASVYDSVHSKDDKKTSGVRSQIHDLLDYELLRQKKVCR